MKKETTLEERFEEAFMCKEHPHSSSCQFKHEIQEMLPHCFMEFMKKELDELMEENTCPQCEELIPSGVSQWRDYGKKYGYWGYFEEEIRNEVIERFGKMRD